MKLKAINLTFDKFNMREVKAVRSNAAPPTAQRGWDWCSCGAVFGLSAGIIAVIIGSLLTAVSWLQSPAVNSYAKVCGTVLLSLTIPLLLFGAHCLDGIERRKNREREKWFNEKR